MKIFETEADLALASLNAGQIVKTKGSAAAFDGNENEWEISTSDGASSIALANGNFALPLTSAKSDRKSHV